MHIFWVMVILYSAASIGFFIAGLRCRMMLGVGIVFGSIFAIGALLMALVNLGIIVG